MATFVSGGANVFGLLTLGQTDQRTLSFLESQFTPQPGFLGQAASAFMEKSRLMYERLSGSEATRLAKAALRAVSHVFQPNLIRPLTTIADLQQAPPIMQRWVMANPQVRQFYHRDQCDGYSGSYLDMYPHVSGPEHVDWQIVHSGLVQDLPDDPQTGEGDWKITNYYNAEEDDPRLTLVESVDILTTWHAIEALMGLGREDPTSPTASKM